MNLDIFKRYEVEINSAVNELRRNQNSHSQNITFLSKIVEDYEVIYKNQIITSNLIAGLLNKVYLFQREDNVELKDQILTTKFKDLKFSYEISKNLENENFEQLKSIKAELEKCESILTELEISLQHGWKLLLYFINFYQEINGLKVLDDYRFCTPMHIGYDFKNKQPIVFEWRESILESNIYFKKSNNLILEILNNEITYNNQNFKINNTDYAVILKIIHCFNLSSEEVNLDYQIINNKYEDTIPIDFLILDLSHKYYQQKIIARIYTEEINVEWNGKYENAPLRIKMMLDFIILNCKFK
jgi:hypothetical protein